MGYLILRSSRHQAHAIVGTIENTDRLIDKDLLRGAYVLLSDISGLDDELVKGLTNRQYLMDNLELLSTFGIPVLKYRDSAWRVWLPPYIVGQIRLAQFKTELEDFMQLYCPLGDRQKIILEAEEALYRLTDVVDIDAFAIKKTTWRYLQEEEEAGRCSLYGWEKFNQLARQFLLKRLFPKFNHNEFSDPATLDDIRSVFNVILLTRMLREQKNLITLYERDITYSSDVETLIDYYFPNPIKPR